MNDKVTTVRPLPPGVYTAVPVAVFRDKVQYMVLKGRHKGKYIFGPIKEVSIAVEYTARILEGEEE